MYEHYLVSEMLSEDLRHDLKVTVDGLNSYLISMKDNIHGQSEQIVGLVHERAEMIQKVKELEPLIAITQDQQAEIAALQQVVAFSITSCGITLV